MRLKTKLLLSTLMIHSQSCSADDIEVLVSPRNSPHEIGFGASTFESPNVNLSEPQISILLKDAKNGNEQARERLVHLLGFTDWPNLTTTFPDLAPECIQNRAIELAKRLFENKDYAKAKSLFALYPDTPISQVYIGQMHQYGYGATVSYNAAVDYFLKALDQQDPIGQKHLLELLKFESIGSWTCNPDGVTRSDFIHKRFKQIGLYLYSAENYEEALPYLETCGRDKECLYILGVMHLKGRGVAQDTQQAIRYLLASRDLGHTKATDRLGKIHLKDNSLDPIPFFTEASEQGNLHAKFTLGLAKYRAVRTTHDPKTGLNLIKEAADLGYLKAQEYLGKLYMDQSNYELAQKYYALAANNQRESATSQNKYELAKLYLEGKVTSKTPDKDILFALDQMHRLERLGHTQARQFMASAFDQGLYIEKNPYEATVRHIELAKDGHQNSKEYLAKLFGLDIVEINTQSTANFDVWAKDQMVRIGWQSHQTGDHFTAHSFLENLTEHPKALYYLGAIHEEEDRVQSTFVHAVRYHAKAAALGQSEALTKLRSIFSSLTNHIPDVNGFIGQLASLNDDQFMHLLATEAYKKIQTGSSEQMPLYSIEAEPTGLGNFNIGRTRLDSDNTKAAEQFEIALAKLENPALDSSFFTYVNRNEVKTLTKFHLGSLLLAKPNQSQENLNRGLTLLTEAATDNCLKAVLYLAQLFRTGSANVPGDLARSISYSIQAANLDRNHALNILQNFIVLPNLTKVLNSRNQIDPLLFRTIYLNQAEEQYQQKKYQEAWNAFNAYPNETESKYYIAEMSKLGQGTSTNYSMAHRLYNEIINDTANTPNTQKYKPLAHLNLGMMFENGQGESKDLDKAKEHYNQSYQLKNWVAGNSLACQYNNDPKTKAQALTIWKECAENGNPHAQYNYAVFGINNINSSEFISLLTSSADAGHTDSQFQLGYAYYSKKCADYGRAWEYFEKAVKKKHPKANFYLGLMSYYGHSVTSSTSTAARYFKTAADLGHATAQYWTGWCYYTGTGQVKDYALASTYLVKSHKNGNTDALSTLCYLFEYNGYLWNYSGSLIKDSHNFEQSWINNKFRQLGESAYANKDFVNAKLYFETTPEDPNCNYYLGRMYLSGEGVSKDTSKAETYLKKAIDLGHIGAKEVLEDHRFSQEMAHRPSRPAPTLDTPSQSSVLTQSLVSTK